MKKAILKFFISTVKRHIDTDIIFRNAREEVLDVLYFIEVPEYDGPEKNYYNH